MRLESFAVGVVFAVATGCSQSTEPPGTALVGGWLAPTEALSPTGTLERTLSFADDGTFQSTVNMYGIYPGNTPGKLSAFTATKGTYVVGGDRLTMTATRQITWDSFYGSGSQPTEHTVNQSVFDQAHFTLTNNALVLNYLTYPADAPVATTLAFFRLMPD